MNVPVIEMTQSVPVFTVFIQGLVSFFSPCIFPLLPLYMGYLAGGTYTVNEDGSIVYPRKKVMLNTLFFVLGISFAFILLGLLMAGIGSFFSKYSYIFTLIGGIIILLFGLYQLDFFGPSKTLSRTRRLPISLEKLSMNPLTALIMGFTFSFAWTPCVGPTLTSVLIMAAGAATRGLSVLLLVIYSFGFVIPFLLLGLFTTQILGFLKKRPKIMKFAVIIGGLLMVGIGVYMILLALPIGK
ncbi:MAG: cytochrome c biogenesis protein CcdA [Eubacteriales bacterium]|nr:cytochrome c biogenesis protein CcdA [Eubacteriales bacterium]MDD4323440.1 cytochrome c biogenesis protein CcdA [Eubacteriales bacterium]MDD4541136.1 cytochrome c biogenesis protein CcdA [Eubacteriales bacterium]